MDNNYANNINQSDWSVDKLEGASLIHKANNKKQFLSSTVNYLALILIDLQLYELVGRHCR